MLGRLEEALRLRRDVYAGFVRFYGEEHHETLLLACNYALSLLTLKHFEEAKSLFRKVIPVARRVRGDNDENTIRMRWYFAVALYHNEGASLDDLREAATTLEDAARTARRVFGSAHPLTEAVAAYLQDAQAALRAREEAVRRRDSVRSICEAVEKMSSGGV